MPDLYKQRAEIYREQKNYKKAIKDDRKYLKYFPKDYIELNNLGDDLFYSQQYKKSVDVYKNVIKINPQYSLSYYNLASAFFDLHDYKKAKEYYSKYLELIPNNPIEVNANVNLTRFQAIRKLLRDGRFDK